MFIFREIVDVLLIVGTLGIVWELSKAARLVASPSNEGVQILASVKALKMQLASMDAQVRALAYAQGIPKPDVELNSETETGDGHYG